MRILTTGEAGFIELHLAEFYREKYNEVYILDNLETGKRYNIKFIEDKPFFNQ